MRILRVVMVAALCAIALAGSPVRARAASIEVPLDLDYLLLDAALKQRYYTAPGGRAQFWAGADDCGSLNAADPHFSRSGASVQLTTRSNLQAALAMGGQCLNAGSWNGTMVAIGQPGITNFELKLHITDLNLYNVDGTAIGGAAFGLIKNGIIAELGSFSYDLRPKLQQLLELANELPPTPAAAQVKAVLASLQLASEIVARDDGIEGRLHLDVPENLLSQCTTPLTDVDKASWRETAGNVSALLTTLAAQTGPLIAEARLRDEISGIAADSRARVEAAANAPPASGDPLPLFRDDWQRLRLALKSASRNGSLDDHSEPVLAAVAAGDLIFALDERAPGLGCQLSRTSLRQLAGRFDR